MHGIALNCTVVLNFNFTLCISLPIQSIQLFIIDIVLPSLFILNIYDVLKVLIQYKAVTGVFWLLLYKREIQNWSDQFICTNSQPVYSSSPLVYMKTGPRVAPPFSHTSLYSPFSLSTALPSSAVQKWSTKCAPQKVQHK